MSTLPMHDLRHSVPSARAGHRGWWFALLILAGVSFWVYSGTAWIWLRPAIHKTLINKYAQQYHLDPLFVMAVIKTESGFSPWARSSRGAVGLMQLLPSTARDIGPDVGLAHITVEDLKDPDTNLRLGMFYLARLDHLFPQDPVAVLASYNAGPGITQQWRKGKPALEMDDIEYPETRQFVKRVQHSYDLLKMVQKWKHFFGLEHGN